MNKLLINVHLKDHHYLFYKRTYIYENILARIDRIKEAKVEAEQAVTAYRNEMERGYQEALSKVCIYLYTTSI